MLLSNYSVAQPLVSVVVPAYNHEDYIEQCIKSVWKQSYSNIELVVINDGSTDSTANIVNKLKDVSPIPFKFIDQSNAGLSASLNRGITSARGQFISILASDDFYSPQLIERYVSIATGEGQDCLYFHCDAFEVDDVGRVGDRISTIAKNNPARGNCFFDILDGNARVVASTVMFRSDLVEKSGLFDEALVQEDFDFKLRAARVTPFFYIDEPLFYSRKLSNSLGRSPRKWIHDGEVAIEKHKDFLGHTYHKYLLKKRIRNIKICLGSGDTEYAMQFYKTCKREFGLSFRIKFWVDFIYFSIKSRLFRALGRGQVGQYVLNKLRTIIRRLRA